MSFLCWIASNSHIIFSSSFFYVCWTVSNSLTRGQFASREEWLYCFHYLFYQICWSTSSWIAEFADEKLEGLKDAATDVSCTVSRRDRATQMSLDWSDGSSPKRRLSFPTSPPAPSIVDLHFQSTYGTNLGIKDVQVDEQVILTRWSKKNKHRIPGKGSGGSEDWRKNDRDTRSSAWDISDATQNIAKLVLLFLCNILRV